MRKWDHLLDQNAYLNLLSLLRAGHEVIYDAFLEEYWDDDYEDSYSQLESDEVWVDDEIYDSPSLLKLLRSFGWAYIEEDFPEIQVLEYDTGFHIQFEVVLVGST